MGRLRGLAELRRVRELAGDARAGSWARGRARTAQRDFVKEHWRLYAGFMAGVLVGAGLVSWFMPTDLLKGMVLGAVLVFGPGALWVVTLQVTGTAPVMMGDQAEQWTASELRKLSRQRWRLVNHFALGRDDIDHVLIGPGGAFAVETKWCASSWQSDYARPRLRDAVAQAQRNAKVLGVWHPFKSRGVPVHPVLVLWGGGVAKWPERERIRVVDDVTVIAGLAVRNWSAQLGEGVLEESSVTDS